MCKLHETKVRSLPVYPQVTLRECLQISVGFV